MQFHSEEYVDFLQRVSPHAAISKRHEKFGIDGHDCPPFEGVFRFSALSAGGSLEGAARLGQQNTDIAINWAGGLHHARRRKAAGFCYINGKFSVSGLLFVVGRLMWC